MFKSYYTEFLSANPDLIHMASHSHHYWPDITRQAVLDSWEDSKIMVDNKWSKIMGEVVPKSQSLIAKILNLKNPEQIVFASNTHELLTRLLSCFSLESPVSILTTDSEFHSATRQFRRCNEEASYDINFFQTERSDFKESFLEEVRSKNYSMIFISQVFFNSGEVLDVEFIKKINSAKPKETLLVVDGYHGFCAVPTDLSSLEDGIFYMAGAYKYAQGGEGMCFMTIPKGCKLRPLNTGWFASFESLEAQTTQVDYAPNGWRFAGSTRDFTAHYRFNAVWEQFFENDISIDKIHTYIQDLQALFLKDNKAIESFTNTDLKSQGHFLTINCGSESKAKDLYERLKSESVLTDFRGVRLRFGFGLYLDKEQVTQAREVLNRNFNEI